MFSPASTVLPHVRDGKLIALASTQLKRAGVRPSCRPCRKPGLWIRHGSGPDCWHPPARPREVVDKLARATNAALQMRRRDRAAAAAGHRHARRHARGIRRLYQSEIAKWSV